MKIGIEEAEVILDVMLSAEEQGRFGDDGLLLLNRIRLHFPGLVHPMFSTLSEITAYVTGPGGRPLANHDFKSRLECAVARFQTSQESA